MKYQVEKFYIFLVGSTITNPVGVIDRKGLPSGSPEKHYLHAIFIQSLVSSKIAVKMRVFTTKGFWAGFHVDLLCYNLVKELFI